MSLLQKIDKEAFEKSIEKAMEEHGCHQVVVVYRNGAGLSMFLGATNELDSVGGEVLFDAISAIIPSVQDKVNNAMETKLMELKDQQGEEN